MEWYEKLYIKDHISLCGFASPEQTSIEAKFVVEVLKLNSSSRLLELCCGFGRHAFEISKLANCQIVGLDLSDDFLSMAKENYSSPNIQYFKGDMRHIQLNDHFDAVTNLFTSFGFFECEEDNEKVIIEVNRILKENGLFLLDYENKFNFVLNDVLQKKHHWEKIGDNKYCLIKNEYDIINEREMFSAKIIEKGKKEVNIGYNIRLYSLPELQNMLIRNGFEILNIWGDFDKSKYSINSRRLITLSRKIKDI